MTKKQFDIVILGAGSAGYSCALRAAQLGLSVALVEKNKVGGTCLHNGCIPTKALLHAAEIADASRESLKFGVVSSFDSIDVRRLHSYKDQVVAKLHKGLTSLIDGRAITVVHGAGILSGANTVDVDGTELRGTHVVLASGARSRSLPSLPIDGQKVLTSDEALTFERVPQSAIVLGGGVIGCELASIWRSFGSDVTLIEAAPHLVPNEDPAVSRFLERAFRKRGIAVRTNSAFQGHEHTRHGVRVDLGGAGPVEAEVLLVAVGREPLTEGLGYAENGVRLEGGFVVTRPRLRTDVPSIYAVGDIVPGLQLAHRGFQHGLFVAEDIAGLAPELPPEFNIPRITYCDPEVASVGLTEDQARQEFGEIETSTYDLAGNGKSQILQTAGLIKLVRRTDGPVVGVHMVGSRVGELIAEAQLICSWEAHPEDVAGLVHAHPTQNEALGEAHLALAGKPFHAHL